MACNVIDTLLLTLAFPNRRTGAVKARTSHEIVQRFAAVNDLFVSC